VHSNVTSKVGLTLARPPCIRCRCLLMVRILSPLFLSVAERSKATFCCLFVCLSHPPGTLCTMGSLNLGARHQGATCTTQQGVLLTWLSG